MKQKEHNNHHTQTKTKKSTPSIDPNDEEHGVARGGAEQAAWCVPHRTT
jgi:hypothetical protein